MRFAVVGAGAIGGYMGACLARAGEDAVLVARGPHLAAMRERGIKVVEPDGSEFVAHPECTDDAAKAVETAEVVFVTLKAYSLAGMAELLGRSLPTGAVLVLAQNGIPWWYFLRGYEGPLARSRIESVDAHGVLSQNLPIESVVACVAYPAVSLVEPGVVHRIESRRFSLGELQGSSSERVTQISSALISAGLRAPVQRHIRNEIWLKLLGNASFNPLSAISRRTLGELGESRDARKLILAMMREIESIARALGERMVVPVERRLEGGFAVGNHRTSMLQDVDVGHQLEVDALLGAPCEIAFRLGIDVPHLRTVDALVRLVSGSQQSRRGSITTSKPPGA